MPMKKYALALGQKRRKCEGLKKETTATGGTRNVAQEFFFEPGNSLVTDFDFDAWVVAGVLCEMPYKPPRAPLQARRATREEVAAAQAAKVAKAAPAAMDNVEPPPAKADEPGVDVAPKADDRLAHAPAKGPKGSNKKNKR